MHSSCKTLFTLNIVTANNALYLDIKGSTQSCLLISRRGQVDLKKSYDTHNVL